MITVKVKQEFHDKDNFSKVYQVGSIHSFDDERAKNLVALGLAEVQDSDDKPRRGRKSIDE